MKPMLVALRFVGHRGSAPGRRAFKRRLAPSGIVQRGGQYPRFPARRWLVHFIASLQAHRRT